MKSSKISVICCCFCVFFGALFAEVRVEDKGLLQQARTLFSTFELNEQSLNQEQSVAVSNMMQLLLKNIPQNPSGQYLTALGDGNYYLGNFGEALLFWRCAELRIPRSVGLEKRIQLVRAVLQMNRPLIERPVTDAIGLCFLPKSMRYMLLLVVWVFAFVFWTLWQWLHISSMRHVFVTLICIAVVLTSCVSWYEWVVPPRVVLLKQTELRGSLEPQMRGERTQYQLSTGEEGEALSFSPDKKWVRVRTGSNQSGYVPGTAVGFVE